MLKRFWPASLLVSAVLLAVAVSPLRAADQSSYSQLVTRARNQPALPNPRTPITTPGDDDMPNRTALPPRGGVPTTGVAPNQGGAQRDWDFQDLWMQIREGFKMWSRFRA